MNNRFLKPKAVLAGENLKYSFCCSFENMESYAFFILPSSLRAKITARIKAAVSAIGPAYITPSIPMNIGKMTTSGNRKITCRVNDMMMPSPAFPIEVKNPADIGWIPFAKVRSIKIRR